MLVFLMQDTLKKAPVGFEKRRRNMFDPEDDNEAESDEVADKCKDLNRKPPFIPDNQEESAPSQKLHGVDDTNVDASEKSLKKEYATCKRKDCIAKSRFDSIYCSDACGVSSLESDLLRTFFYSSDIHPSALRH
jgi:hypothetical protein